MHPLLALLAEQTAPAPPPGPGPGLFDMLVLVAPMLLIFWFFGMRPQAHRDTERKEMLKRLKKNDHVITTGGIHGVVTSVKDDEVTLRVDEAQNVRIRFARSAIAGIVGEGEAPQVGEDRPGK